MKTVIRPVIVVLLMAATVVAKSQVPFLSSHPTAPAVIYLDFDGHTVTGTSWNYNGPIVCGASGLDNSQITEVFNRVAEDYRPFNVNITTDSTKFLAAAPNRRMRVILTVTSSWYGAAGGVAFVSSFSWGDDNPCFVFSALLNYNPKNISEAAAHEAGHTLGLYHQASYDASCNKLTDYNAGAGSGEIGWAPIMGVGYYRNMTLWNNGPNSYGCSNMQSDLDVITSGTNGFTYRTDDYGSDFANAANASFSSNQFALSGIVERNTDVDYFKFTMLSFGRFELNAVPYNVGTGNTGSDLDLQVSLFSPSQALLNVYNPGTLLSSVIDTTLNPGVYYLKVEGRGNQFAPNYASLGSYSLTGKATPATVLPLRSLVLRGNQNGNLHQLSWTVEADEAIQEQTLEVAKDGRHFELLTNTNVADRAYNYRPDANGSLQYRLHVVLANGWEYYSNIISIDGKNNALPHLVSNLVTNHSMTIISPSVFEYSVVDLNGKLISKGKIGVGSNQVQVAALTAGMYILRFDNGSISSTQKFVSQ